jgi:hypothetical protein
MPAANNSPVETFSVPWQDAHQLSSFFSRLCARFGAVDIEMKGSSGIL